MLSVKQIFSFFFVSFVCFVVNLPPPYQTAAARSLYIHVPFCRHRCGYCNFSVLAGRADLHDRYLDAIEKELREAAGGETLHTIFIGGGTPTQLDADRWRRLFEIIHGCFDVADDAEISSEANPEDCDDAIMSAMASVGVNRISFGVQSFDAGKLATLQRGHTPRSAVAAIELASRRIGRVSVDLIYGAPGETATLWRSDLRTAMSLPIEHLSAYCLTYEKGTAFWTARHRGKLTPVDERVEDVMETATLRATAAAGFSRYEISSYARPGGRCRHNLAYWRGDSWLAAGPAAASFVRGVRAVNHRSVTRYLRMIETDGSAIDQREVITPIDHLTEGAAFGVRQTDGVDVAELSRRSGLDAAALLHDTTRRMIDAGWVCDDPATLKLTGSGLRFADAVAAEYLAVTPPR